MPLTSEQFEQLTRFLATPPWDRGGPQGYDGPERRETPRTAARGPAELRLPPRDVSAPARHGAFRNVTVYVHDVSLGGLGLLSGSLVRPESEVELTFTNGHDDLTLRCSVRHCTTLAVGLYGVGVDVLAYEVREADAGAQDSEASAAWAGFFNSRRGTTATGMA
jgi:hypothetical protein